MSSAQSQWKPEGPYSVGRHRLMGPVDAKMGCDTASYTGNFRRMSLPKDNTAQLARNKRQLWLFLKPTSPLPFRLPPAWLFTFFLSSLFPIVLSPHPVPFE